jgi:4-amino-4-deoxy-L-arabinose transferase-like glycosyltransferase
MKFAVNRAETQLGELSEEPIESDNGFKLPPFQTSLRPKILVFFAVIGVVLSSWIIIPNRYFLAQNGDYRGFFLPAAQNFLLGYGFTWHGASLAEGIPDVGYHLAPGRPLANFPPAYVLIVAAAVATADQFHIPAMDVVDALNLLAVGLCAVSLFMIAAGVFGQSRALIAPLLFVTYPGILLATKGGNHELQFCAAVLGALAVLWRSVQCASRRIPGFFAAGLLFGGAMLIRAQSLALVPACMIWLLVFPRQEKLRLRLRWMAIMLIATTLVILPWEIWLYARLGRVVPLATEGPAAVYRGLVFAVKSGPTGDQPAAGVPDEVKRLSADFLAECGLHPSTAQMIAFVHAQLRLHPKATTEFFLLKVVRSWYASSSGRFDHESLAMNLVYGLLFVRVFAVALHRPGPPRLLGTLVLSVVLSTWAITILVFSIVRYMLPAIAVMFVLAPAAIGVSRKPPNSQPVRRETSDDHPGQIGV